MTMEGYRSIQDHSARTLARTRVVREDFANLIFSALARIRAYRGVSSSDGRAATRVRARAREAAYTLVYNEFRPTPRRQGLYPVASRLPRDPGEGPASWYPFGTSPGSNIMDWGSGQTTEGAKR